MTGRIFSIESVRSRQPGKGNILRLKVNFMPEIITLAKEVSLLPMLLVKVFWLFDIFDINISLLMCRVVEYEVRKVSTRIAALSINISDATYELTCMLLWHLRCEIRDYLYCTIQSTAVQPAC